MTSGDELLSCPFCGGAAEVREWDFPYVRFQARCVECKTTGRTRFNERAKAIAAWNHRTPPTPATDAREVVARALCEARIRTVRRHDTKPEDLEAMLPASIDYSWRDFVAEADAALSALAPIRAAEILAAEANERARIEADLKDPQIVHMNMLRGGIAKINVTQAMHLNGWTSIDNWHRMTVEQIEAAVKARNEHGAGK